MGSIYNGHITPGSDYQTVFNKVYPILNGTITIPSGAGDTATVVVTCDNNAWFQNTSTGWRLQSKLVLCDSNGNNEVTLFSKTMDPNTSDRTSITKVNVDISALKGKRIYAKVVPLSQSGGSGVIINTRYDTDGLQISIVFRVRTGEIIRASDRSQTGTSTTVGAIMKDSHFSSGTKITASSFNSTVLDG